MTHFSNCIVLNKKEGETPLLALEKFRSKHKELKDKKMTYAGRLDPMASGLLVVLIGDETKNKEKYLALDKEYRFEVLFGFTTDTYDVLGKVEKVYAGKLKNKELEKIIKENLKYFIGKFKQTYPIYSSKTVKGKPLFSYARLGLDVDLPEREVFVKSLKLLKIKSINSRILFRNIEKRVGKVQGDFRQKEIKKIWRKKINYSKDNIVWKIGEFNIECSSGTYVRSVANSLGGKIGIPAIAFSIKRTRIGKWRQEG